MLLEGAELFAGVAEVGHGALLRAQLHVLQGSAGQPGLPGPGTVQARPGRAAADHIVVHALALLAAGAVHLQLAFPAEVSV